MNGPLDVAEAVLRPDVQEFEQMGINRAAVLVFAILPCRPERGLPVFLRFKHRDMKCPIQLTDGERLDREEVKRWAMKIIDQCFDNPEIVNLQARALGVNNER